MIGGPETLIGTKNYLIRRVIYCPLTRCCAKEIQQDFAGQKKINDNEILSGDNYFNILKRRFLDI